jgi:ribosomal-protein-alanine N-acetyltransferase
VVLIRRFQASDIFAVIKLAYTNLPERYNPILFNRLYETFPEGFFVAEQNHKLIGFIAGIRMSDTSAKILMIAVEKPKRKQGVGRLLITHFFEELQRQYIRTVDLEVRTTNTTALKFYKTHGFLKKERIPKFYNNGEDAFVMQCRL